MWQLQNLSVIMILRSQDFFSMLPIKYNLQQFLKQLNTGSVFKISL